MLTTFDARGSIALAVLAAVIAMPRAPHETRVLYVAVAPGAMPRLLTGFEVTTALPIAMPELARYDAVIVSDVPAHLLDAAALDRYALAGGTLLIGGGAESFGTGAYEATALERMMPVRFDDGCRFTPDFAVAIVIDGSPAARGKAVEIIDQLSPSDYVTVIGRELVPPRRAAYRRELAVAIDRLTAGAEPGAIQEARTLLDGISAASKHVVVVNADTTPEQIAAALAPVDDELVHVRGAPPLRGMVEMRTKARAVTLLATTTGAPLLARWRRGAGVVLAWTSDLDGAWAADWVTRPGYAAFWRAAISGDSPRPPLP